MEHIDYFKLQAKNLLRDYKTQYQDEGGLCEYKPRFFNDIDDIIMNFDVNEDEPLALMNAQHIIAKLAGFDKWAELIAASVSAREIGKLLFENRHETGGIMTNLVPSIIVEDWKNFLREFMQINNLSKIDDGEKLRIFKEYFMNEGVAESEVKRPSEILMELWLDYFEDEHRRQVWKYAKDVNEKKANPFKYKTKVPAYFGGMPLQVFNIWQMLDKFTQEEKDEFDNYIDLLIKADELVNRPRQRRRTKLTEEYYNNHNPFAESKWDTYVECLHCGKEFLFNDAVIENELIVCPHEDCDGTLIDFMPAGMMTAQNGRNGANRNSPCPCGSGKKYKQCCGKGE